jgi:hypothetical protein
MEAFEDKYGHVGFNGMPCSLRLLWSDPKDCPCATTRKDIKPLGTREKQEHKKARVCDLRIVIPKSPQSQISTHSVYTPPVTPCNSPWANDTEEEKKDTETSCWGKQEKALVLGLNKCTLYSE